MAEHTVPDGLRDEVTDGVAPGGADAVLLEPARQQVLGLAAHVLGGLSADDVPAALRAIARFTPAKRLRLGATALAAALDADESFRAAVAVAVEQTSPELVAAVRAGAPTAAADPLDIAVIAYLVRPQGWTQTLTAANERWLRERTDDTSPRADAEALRAEAAALRARAKGEPARTREAVTAAVADADAQLRAAQRSLRERTGQLRAAQRARDEAQGRVAELEDQLDAQVTTHDAEIRRMRARVADGERAIEAARRVARSERDVDDARLWLLVDTLVQAANGVRRELSLAAPQLRPADAVVEQAGSSGSSADAAGSGRSVRDPAALDSLLALPQAHLIVDGYNVTKTGYGERSLADQRARLIGALAALAGRSGAEVTVVFDGATRPPVQPGVPRGVRVLFSASDQIADDVIRRLVAAEPSGRVVVVVTSDRQVVIDTARSGAWTVPSSVLLARLG